MGKPSKDGYYGFKPDVSSDAEPAHVWVNGSDAVRYRLFGYNEDDWSFVDNTEDWQWSNLKFEPMAEELDDLEQYRVDYSDWLSSKASKKYVSQGAIYSGLVRECPKDLADSVIDPLGPLGKYATIWKG
jgi:hypothetical protein